MTRRAPVLGISGQVDGGLRATPERLPPIKTENSETATWGCQARSQYANMGATPFFGVRFQDPLGALGRLSLFFDLVDIVLQTSICLSHLEKIHTFLLYQPCYHQKAKGACLLAHDVAYCISSISKFFVFFCCTIVKAGFPFRLPVITN